MSGDPAVPEEPAPDIEISDHDEAAHHSSLRQLRLGWIIVFLWNLMVPLSLGLNATRTSGRIGMSAAVIFLRLKMGFRVVPVSRLV